MLPKQTSTHSWKTLLTACTLLAGLSVFAVQAHAADVTLSGFMSIAGGKVLNGNGSEPIIDTQCPCFVNDWYNMGTYNSSWSWRPESRIGIRLNGKMTDSLSGVMQIDASDTRYRSGPTLEWAYLGWRPLGSDWEVNLGRKRLPIYYYSDFSDVGFAYPWVRPPQELYGWEINNFNGATIVHHGQLGSISTRGSVFFGREDSHDNAFMAYWYGVNDKPDVSWSNITGADIEFSQDWFNVRLVYIQSNVYVSSLADGVLADGRQRIYGISANIDHNNWLVRSEYSYFDRWKELGYRSNAYMAGVGYHFGSLTPMLTYSYFSDVSADGTPTWKNSNTSLTLRYDLNSQSDIKVQYDQYRELSAPGSTSGNANVISVSYDRVF